MQQVLDLVTHDGCQTNALVGYFGEVRAAPCGHCTYCATGRVASLPPPRAEEPIETLVNVEEWDALRAAHPAAWARRGLRPASSAASAARH